MISIPWYQYFEYLSFLAAVAFARGLYSVKLTVFVPLLFVICAIEIAAAQMVIHGVPTYTLYNAYLLVTTPMFFYAFYRMLGYNNLRRYLLLGICFLILFFITANFLFIQGADEFNTISLIMIEFVKVILALLVLLSLFDRADNNSRIYQYPFFWISAGTLLFSLCSLVILGLQQLIRAEKVQIDGKNIYRILQPVVIAVLYSSYCVAFYLCKRLARISQPS